MHTMCAKFGVVVLNKHQVMIRRSAPRGFSSQIIFLFYYILLHFLLLHSFEHGATNNAKLKIPSGQKLVIGINIIGAEVRVPMLSLKSLQIRW